MGTRPQMRWHERKEGHGRRRDTHERRTGGRTDAAATQQTETHREGRTEGEGAQDTASDDGGRSAIGKHRSERLSLRGRDAKNCAIAERHPITIVTNSTMGSAWSETGGDAHTFLIKARRGPILETLTLRGDPQSELVREIRSAEIWS